MFVKKSSPKIEEIKISDTMPEIPKMNKCRKCGKPFIPKCIDGVCEIYCPKCASEK